jgi:hypothetical protein
MFQKKRSKRYVMPRLLSRVDYEDMINCVDVDSEEFWDGMSEQYKRCWVYTR